MMKNIRFVENNDYSIFYANQIYGNKKNEVLLYRLHCLFNPFLGFFFRIHTGIRTNTLFPLPFKSIWYRAIIKKIGLKKDDAINLFVDAPNYYFVESGFLLFLKKKFEVRHTTLILTDKYSLFVKRQPRFEINRINNLFDTIVSYNQADCNSFGFRLQTPWSFDYSMVDNDDSLPESDLYFIGKNKGRVKIIQLIYNLANEKGLICDFYIDEVTDDEALVEGIHYNKKMSYCENLKHVKKTKCVLNIMQEGSCGITLRDYEAAGNNKILFSNCQMACDSGIIDKTAFVFLKDFEKNTIIGCLDLIASKIKECFRND